jgi:beta-mannosidase
MRFSLNSILTFFFILPSHYLFSQDLKKINLGGEWKFRKAGTVEWMIASVPGGVHTDLIRNKIIPDPFFGDNEKKVQWISDTSWEYEKSFFVSDILFRASNAELVCEGLDTYANVYLNDSLIIVADNMFREWDVNIKNLLKPGINHLRIQFPSITAENKIRYKRLGQKLPGDEKVVCRKAAYQFGWDWGPTLITCGIWRPIYIRCWNYLNIKGVQYVQRKLTDSIADLTAEFTILSIIKGFASIQLTVNDKLVATKMVAVQTGLNSSSVDFQIRNPKRWWPNGLGNPFLYPILYSIYYQGNKVASGIQKLGLRTLELRQDKDTSGSCFYFLVNGVPVFMKGANYIPPDNFLPRVTDSTYKALIASVKSANMNMLRVWGGGTYEKDIFYDLCDENGILVWQEFMFACAMYPGDSDFIRNVREEAIENVIRLRNHPCIALWCGNNEIDEGWKNWGWQKQYEYTPEDSGKIWSNYVSIFREILPDVISKYDPQRPYIQSSPLFGWGHKESLKEGDMHYWGVWWGKEPFSSFCDKTGRFISEYGFQGFLPMESIRKFTSVSDRQLGSTVMKAHQKHPVGYETIDEYLLRDYKKPKDFESYDYVSQVLQAEGIKTAIEAHRRAKPFCMGTLYWQLNDCWPVVSWSSRDYYGNQKALHYFAKNEYATLLVSPVIKNGKLQVFVISDSLKDCHADLHLYLTDFRGQKSFDTLMHVTIKNNSSACFFESMITNLIQGKDPGKLVFIAQLTSGNRAFSRNNIYLRSVRDLLLEKPLISKSIKRIQKGYLIVLTTDRLAKNIYLTSEKEGSFSDNFFDLLPGETRTICFITNDLNNSFESSLKILTVADTY